MIEIVTKVVIHKKSPEQVFNFLLSLNKDTYRAMAPKAHKDFKILKPVETITGSIYYFHEKIGELDISHVWLATKAKRNEYLFQKAQMLYPVTIEIYLTKIKEGTKLTQKILVGFTLFGIERIFDCFIRLFILAFQQTQMLHNHTIEEFSSLEQSHK